MTRGNSKKGAIKKKGGLSINTYNQIHNHIRRKHGCAKYCENKNCLSLRPKRFEWALKKGRKYSINIEDYLQLCPSCHRKYDETIHAKKKLSAAHKGKHYHGRDRVVSCYSLSGDFLINYETSYDAARKLNISRTGIANCLSGLSKSSNGFIWKYADGVNKSQKYVRRNSVGKQWSLKLK